MSSVPSNTSVTDVRTLADTIRYGELGPEQRETLIDLLHSVATAVRLAPGSNRVKWLGSGLYVCGVCDRPALRVSQTGNHRHPAYRCKARDNTGHSGGHVTRAAPPLDEYVERIIVARLHQLDATSLFTTPAAQDLDAAFAQGVITLAQLRTGTTTLRARLTEIEDTLTAAAQVNPLIGLAGQPHIAEIWYGSAPDRSDGLDLGRRRAVLATLLTVTVLPTSKGRGPTAAISIPPESTSNGKHTDHAAARTNPGCPRICLRTAELRSHPCHSSRGCSSRAKTASKPVIQ